jgi:protein TonB
MSAVLSAPTSGISERDLVSLGLSAVALVLFLMAGQIQLSADTEILSTPITLTTEVAPPEPKKQATAEPQKPEPQKAEPKPAQAAPTAQKVESKTLQAAATSQQAVAEKVTQVDNSASTVAPSQPSRPSQAPAAAPSFASPDVKRVDVNGEFENVIRSLIEASKRYPTGREASLQKPQGVVVACVVLQRNGELQEMKVQKSSTYPILDNAAKRLLANLQYPPMPPDTFPGQASHSFCVNLDYKTPA